MNGFVNICKPVGATASDIVVCVKRILHEKAGHLGTLDPGAAGVLPVAVGQATRLFDFLTNMVKYYRAFFTFGKTTDTLDSYGVVTATSGVLPDKEQVEAAIKTFVGQIEQMPPAYSAISVGGVRAYKLARDGVEVNLATRPVTIYEYSLVRQESDDTFIFDIKCSGGTYIRSLVRDLAALLGTVGYMSGLICLASGCFGMSDSVTIDELRERGDSCLVDITYPLADVPVVEFPSKQFDDIDFGRKVKLTGAAQGYFKVVCRGVLFGLGRNDNGILKLDYYLKNAVNNPLYKVD